MAAWSPSTSSTRAWDRGRATAISVRLGREALPILACCTLTGLVVATLRHVFATDGWLALTAGRLVAHQGLPHHDTLTVVARGRTWIDEQWLGQLALFGLQRAGGVRLVLGANLLLIVAAFAVAVVCARRRGGRPGGVAVVALAAIIPYLIAAGAVRPQSFAYLPFVVLVAVVSARSVMSWTRVMLVLAGLVVWANVHGSVLLAVALVAGRGGFDLVAAARRRRFDSRSAVLAVAPFACLFASPYGLSLASYYHATAFNSAFTQYLEYWSPTRPSAYTLPLYGLLLTAVWLLGRVRRVYSGYEAALLLLAVALGLLAIRNWPFATLLVLMLAPAGLAEVFPHRRVGAAAVAASLALVTVAATVAGVTVALTRPAATYTAGFPPRAAALVARAVASDPKSTIYASGRFADWLVWQEPALSGRVRTDARYELLSAKELERVTLFRVGSGVEQTVQPHELFVLDPDTDRRAIDALRPRVRVLYSSRAILLAVVRRS